LRPAIQPRPSTAFTDLDLDRDGKQIGFFHIPQSPHEDAWGTVPVPLAVICNGKGPTVLIEGGNHGDEYEGPIALGELIRALDPASIQGRIIAIPAINQPAAAAGRRTSPDDGLNFNRTFPGDPNGTITRQISAFVHDRLFPVSDFFLDLHSGGSSLQITPCGIVEPAPDPDHHRRNLAAVLAYDAPLTVMLDNLGEPRTATASAIAAGLTVVGTEMGGGGTVSIDALEICRRGIRNILAHAGLIEPGAAPPRNEPARTYAVPGRDGYVLAADDGVFEPCDRLGAEVRAGGLAGRVHFLTDPARKPAELRYRADGIVFSLRQPGRVKPGNCCAVVASTYRGAMP
jgi:predicted deacylase